MNTAEIYHTAITVLLDIVDKEPASVPALDEAIQFLKEKRITALGREHKIAVNNIYVRTPEFIKPLDEATNELENAPQFNFKPTPNE